MPWFATRSALFPYTTLFRSWRPGCPVAPAQLRTVVATHWDNAGRVRTGRLIVAAEVAEDVAAILEDLYRERFPIQRMRSEEHTSELQSRGHLVCRLLLEKKK